MNEIFLLLACLLIIGFVIVYNILVPYHWFEQKLESVGAFLFWIVLPITVILGGGFLIYDSFREDYKVNDFIAKVESGELKFKFDEPAVGRYNPEDQIPVVYRLTGDLEDHTYPISMFAQAVRFELGNTQACLRTKERWDEHGRATFTVSCSKELQEPIKVYAHFNKRVDTFTYTPWYLQNNQ